MVFGAPIKVTGHIAFHWEPLPPSKMGPSLELVRQVHVTADLFEVGGLRWHPESVFMVATLQQQALQIVTVSSPGTLRKPRMVT